MAFLLFYSRVPEVRRNQEGTRVANPTLIEGKALSVLNGARDVVPSAERLAFAEN